ncbi:MAG: 30S ribosomal protein S6 [Alphaproteobacteria bacterium]|nr:30S ribosomal protein S6 [Alphaproteobacteria bacterium]
MPLYEHVVIVRQDVSSAQVESLASNFADVVKEHGGKVEKTEHWGLRSLAYRIKKNRKGHYVLLNLDAPPAALQELERTERLNEDILRYMTIRVDALEEAPSIMMRNRSDRDDSPRERSNDTDRRPPPKAERAESENAEKEKEKEA